MQKTTKDLNWQENEALARYILIAPMLDPALDAAKRSSLRREAARSSGLSERTIYRYLAAYGRKGFEGLKPAAPEQAVSRRLPDNYREIVGQAIQLRKEVPTRSVEQIIFILEQEGWAAPGSLRRSTLQRHLYRAGFGTKQMQLYRDARGSSSKRFCKPNRMMLVQADIKYGCRLPIGKGGAMVQTYLSSAIDDHSRFLLHSRFYDSQEEGIVEDTFRQAILKAGACDAVYFDNGSQYTAKQLKFSLAKLGITVRHAPVRSGKSKGKQEKFHQVVDAFLREVKIHGIKTLEELNHHWANYLEEYYHKRPHDGIREYYESLGAAVPKEGITPLQEWNRDSRPLRFLDVSVVTEAFLHHEERLVDKGACISFRGRRYETKPSLIGSRVEISYDPSSPETITVKYPGIEPFTAKPLEMKEFCDQTPALPVSMQEKEPECSRMLEVLEKKRRISRKHMADAVSFGQYRKDGGNHV